MDGRVLDATTSRTHACVDTDPEHPALGEGNQGSAVTVDTGTRRLALTGGEVHRDLEETHEQPRG